MRINLFGLSRVFFRNFTTFYMVFSFVQGVNERKNNALPLCRFLQKTQHVSYSSAVYHFTNKFRPFERAAGNR